MAGHAQTPRETPSREIFPSITKQTHSEAGSCAPS
jgi:hypothetical protein